MAALLLAAAQPTQAQSSGDAYSVQTDANGKVIGYSGGTYTTTTNGVTTTPANYFYPFNDNNTIEYGAAPGSGGPAGTTVGVSMGGALGATLVWKPAIAGTPPPATVIVWQHCVAGWSNAVSNTGSASCTLDAGNGPVSETASDRIRGDKYTVQTNPGAQFTIASADRLSPSVSGSGTVGSGGSINGIIGYTATAAPVTITLAGTTADANGKPNILNGQSCTASLSGIPTGCVVSNYQWGVSGTMFQSWSPTTPAHGATPANPNASEYRGGRGPLTNATAHWYFNDKHQAPETVTCTATVTPAAGQGAAFQITASQIVTVQVPGWVGFGTGGYMQVNANAPNLNGAISLYAGPDAGQSGGGMNWVANVMSSALFTSGALQLVQIVTPKASYVTYPGVGVPGVTRTDPEDQIGLDTVYPSPWETYGSYMPPYTPTYYTTSDSPTIGLFSSMESVTMQHQFTDYLMFQPPAASYASPNYPAVQLVPLATFSWSTNGNATAPSTHDWADYTMQNGSDAAGTVSPNMNTTFVSGNSFPSWTRINVFPQTSTWQ